MNKESSAINPSSLEYIQVTPEDHYVRKVPAYHEIRNEFKIYDGLLASRKPLLIQGPKGIGKTLSIAKLANKAKIAVLCLEEVGSLAPAMQKLLNPLLDWRSGLYVDALDKTFHLEEDAKLIVFATSNPSNNGGIYELNQDLKSRFAIWNWNYPETKDEMSMVNLTDVPKEFSKGIFLLAMETRALEKNGSLDYAISTRDISDAFHLYRSYKSVDGINAEQLVLDLKILGNYDAEDQIDTIKSRIESIFGKAMFDVSSKTQ